MGVCAKAQKAAKLGVWHGVRLREKNRTKQPNEQIWTIWKSQEFSWVRPDISYGRRRTARIRCGGWP